MAGVPVEPRFKHPKQAKPEIWVIADISGSVAAFARFTLHLVHAIASQFSKVRSFVFIDGIDEVTGIFERSETVGEAVHRVNVEADVVWVDGHSDYGHALTVLLRTVGPRDRPEGEHPVARRRPQQLPRLAGMGRRVSFATGPAGCSGSTPSLARTGEAATRSSSSTPSTATPPTSAGTCASSRRSWSTWPKPTGGGLTGQTGMGRLQRTQAQAR